MTRHVFISGGQRFTRIHKSQARRMWAGEARYTIALCPVKLRPGFPFSPHITCFNQEQKERAFEAVVGSFIWYNCTCNETGYYPAFYLVEGRAT